MAAPICMGNSYKDAVYWSSNDGAEHKVYFFLWQAGSLTPPPFEPQTGVVVNSEFLLVPAGKEIGPLVLTKEARHAGQKATGYWIQVDDSVPKRPQGGESIMQVPPVVDADG